MANEGGERRPMPEQPQNEPEREEGRRGRRQRRATEARSAVAVLEKLADIEERKLQEEQERKIEEEAHMQARLENFKERDKVENFAGLNIQQLNTFFQPEDEETLRALSSVENLATFTQKVREDVIKSKFPGLQRPLNQTDQVDLEEIDRQTSREIEQRIVVTFSKLTRRVDQERPDQPFEEIVRQGSLYGSIEIVRMQLLQRVQLLNEEVERRASTRSKEPLPEILQGRFYKTKTEKVLGTKKIDIGGPERKTINTTVIKPMVKEEETNLSEFLHGLHHQIDSEYTARAYMHNVRLIFRRGKGAEGFWDQLRGFAQNLGSTDIDNLTSLPDNELFMSAYRLYTKYVEERFALHDWVHQPNMFINDISNVTSEIEDKVYDDLKRLFKEEGQDEWRMRRALNFGVGLAKGVFLTEIEAAAWADPNVRTDKDGKPTFDSYYTNDNSALQTLNPLHYYLRWQQEGMLKGPVLHMPVEGYERRHFGLWDHAKLWDRMAAFKESWKVGKSAYERFKNKAEKTFFEILPNIGKVGSFVTRSGWRMEAASEGWMIYDEETGTQLKIKESWQEIENIGYEALLNFAKDRLRNSFIFSPSKKTARDALKERGVRDATGDQVDEELKDQIKLRKFFFSYLNQRFINFDSGTGGVRRNLADEIKETRRQLTDEKKAATLKKNPREREVKVKDEEIYERLLYKALAGALRKRIPTKFIRIERDRTSDKGLRAWDVVRNQLEWDSTRMDRTMDNLLMVELRLRQETTNGMIQYLEEGNKNLQLYDGRGYAVTEASIEKVLKDVGLEGEIDDTKALFRQINTSFLENNDYMNNFAKSIQNNEFPFALATEELETKFLAFRAAGESVLMRTMGDTASIEQHFTDKLQSFFDLLHKTSIDPSRDMSKIYELMEEMKTSFEHIHGPNTGWKIIHHLTGVTVAYFKKDTVAKAGLLGVIRFARLGRINSIAAEVAGTYRGVWEWDNGDIDTFITELERRRLVPKALHELSFHNLPDVNRRTINVFGREISLGYKLKHHPENQMIGRTLRKDFGATKLDIASEWFNRVLPLIMIFVALQALVRGAKEEFGGKSK